MLSLAHQLIILPIRVNDKQRVETYRMQRCRLDRHISSIFNISRRDVRLMLAQKRVVVDGVVVDDIALIVDKFSQVSVDGKTIASDEPSYVMLHKPIGVVSATKDDEHKTVLDLLDQAQYPQKPELHIVGRLDLNTSGLVLLTNDSRWSESLTQPGKKVAKCYHVTLQNPLTSEYIEAFAQGMYFEYEDITTLPAILEIVSEYEAKVTLIEGRYHQIKRMFGRFRNPVVGLHRFSIGNLTLDQNLTAGQSRPLTTGEVLSINK